jgi:hypothetical protein
MHCLDLHDHNMVRMVRIERKIGETGLPWKSDYRRNDAQQFLKVSLITSIRGCSDQPFQTYFGHVFIHVPGYNPDFQKLGRRSHRRCMYVMAE